MFLFKIKFKSNKFKNGVLKTIADDFTYQIFIVS